MQKNIGYGKMDYTIGTVVKFETAHRQLGDTSKCGFLHGHNWTAEITITASNLNSIGYVVDFKRLKDAINDSFDHKTILNKDDMLVKLLIDSNQRVSAIFGNPTCEVLAGFVLEIIKVSIDKTVVIKNITVKLFENDNSYAEVHFP